MCPIDLYLPEVPPLLMKAIKGLIIRLLKNIKSGFINLQFFWILLFNYLFIHLLAILKIDGKVATQDKMNCITKCSKAIFHMLKISNQGLRPISADDFFPTLVFVCIKANPPRIQSNLNFVRRFANDNKLTMGEGGYLFANIVR